MHMLELFHGPTLAFKDHAMQFLGLAFDHVLQGAAGRSPLSGRHRAIPGPPPSRPVATAFHQIFILHPHGRVSDVQRRQMTTVAAANVHNIALEGSRRRPGRGEGHVRRPGFPDAHRLGAVNSINWARIMAQIVYYVWAAVKLDATDRELDFAVPTGNFGNIFAGYGAKRMGLPIRKPIVGTNRNDVLPRFLDPAAWKRLACRRPSAHPWTFKFPQFERFLFDLMDRDGAAVAETMRNSTTAAISALPPIGSNAPAVFVGHRLDDDETMAVIGDIPTTIGRSGGPARRQGMARPGGGSHGTPIVVLATAHPAKFPAAWKRPRASAQAFQPAWRSIRAKRTHGRAAQRPGRTETFVANRVPNGARHGVRVTTLDNGLRVATDAMTTVETVSVCARVGVGARLRPPIATAFPI